MSMRRAVILPGLFLCVSLTYAQSPTPQLPQRESVLLVSRRAVPDFDSRQQFRANLMGRAQAVQAFQTRFGPSVEVSVSERTGGVRQVFRTGEYLTGGQAGDASSILDRFLAENTALFGFGPGELQNWVSAGQHNDDAGVSHIYLRQEIRGVRVFETLLKGHVDSGGRIISVEGNYYPGTYQPVLPSTLNAESAVRAAMLSSVPDLLQKAATGDTTASAPSSVGSLRLAPGATPQSFPQLVSRASTPDQATIFDRGPFHDNIRASLVIFPRPNGPVFGWQVYLHAADRQAAYVIVVDARTGGLLYRTNTYRSNLQSRASIFPKNPDETPLTVVPYRGLPSLSPAGWSNVPATIGNNVQGDSATSPDDFIYPFTDAWRLVGPNTFDLTGRRVRFIPVNPLATGYVASVSTAGPLTPAATNLVPLFTNKDDGTINLICGAGLNVNVLGATFSSVWVNTNGTLSFGGGNTSPQASKVLFSNGPRQIAGLWRDLDPGAGGTLTGDCAPERAGQRFRFVWTAVPNYAVPGTPHTFAVTVHGIGTGLDNIIDIDFGTVSSPLGQLVGVGGNSVAPFNVATPGIVSYVDLSVGAAGLPTGGIAQTFPDPDLNLSITNFSYHLNKMHDYYYALGFTEPAGNFQTSNFERGGAALDPVQAEAQYGLNAFNNAFFVTPPDGLPAFTAFGLFSTNNGACRRDSGFAADVIYHEFTHGVSTRMVGGPQNIATLGSFQGGALGEGWSDAFAISVLDDPVTGAYVVCNPAGIRSAPYNVSTLKYSDFGNKLGPIAVGIGQIFIPEVHQDGEIWAAAMWDLHTRLGRVSELLMFDGLRYTPVEPSMLDAKNAMLIAETVRFRGIHNLTLNTVFAARGMGRSASTSPGSFDGFPLQSGWHSTVFAAFDTPAQPYGPGTQVVYSENFEGTSSGWTTQGTDGAGGPALWHLSSRQSSSLVNSGVNWQPIVLVPPGTTVNQRAYYYGRETTGTYDTGARNYGSLISPPIVLPSLGARQALALEWDHLRSTQDAFVADGGFVRISDVATGQRTQVSFVQNTLTSSGSPEFAHQRVNLDQFAGRTIRVEFYMDTLDNVANAAEGWYVDNVRISVLGTPLL